MFIPRKFISVVYPQYPGPVSCTGRNNNPFVDSSTENLKYNSDIQVFSTVIHRHNDGRKTAADWRKYAVSAIMEPR